MAQLPSRKRILLQNLAGPKASARITPKPVAHPYVRGMQHLLVSQGMGGPGPSAPGAGSSPLTFELLQHVPHAQAALRNAVVLLQGHRHSFRGLELHRFTPERTAMRGATSNAYSTAPAALWGLSNAFLLAAQMHLLPQSPLSSQSTALGSKHDGTFALELSGAPEKAPMELRCHCQAGMPRAGRNPGQPGSMPLGCRHISHLTAHSTRQDFQGSWALGEEDGWRVLQPTLVPVPSLVSPRSLHLWRTNETLGREDRGWMAHGHHTERLQAAGTVGGTSSGAYLLRMHFMS